MARNPADKARYAALANASSRNQNALKGPYIGRFEIVTHVESERVVEGEDGPKIIKTIHKLDKSIQKIVHDEGPKSAAKAATIYGNPTRTGRARSRQIEAWKRCAWLREHKAHDFGGRDRRQLQGLQNLTYPSGNCASCGCPQGEAEGLA